MIVELFETYKKNRISQGPLLKGNEEFSLQQAITITFAEAFVIAHEMGHFFNGDLDDDSSFKPLFFQPEIGCFENNKNHKREFAADIFGFRLYAKYICRKYPKVDTGTALFSVIFTFDTMAAISDTETHSHPDPLTRLFHIVLYFFGEEAAHSLCKTYTEENMGNQFRDVCQTLSLEAASKNE